MRTKTFLTAAGVVPLSLVALPGIVRADACAPPEGVFATGRWRAHGFDEFSGSDMMSVQAGYRELRFDLTVDGGGVLTGGSLALTAGGTAAAFDGMSGAEATWSVVGDLTGVASNVQVDGTYQMDIGVSQSMTDLGGDVIQFDTPLSIGPDPVTLTFRPTDADCTFAVGVLEGSGVGQEPLPWTAFRVGGRTPGDLAERYEDLTRRGVELASAEDFDLDAMVGLIRDLIGFTSLLSKAEDCLGSQNAARIGSPQVAYAQQVLRQVLLRFTEVMPNFSVAVIVSVMSLGFEASGLQAELCNGTASTDDTELLARFEAELLERFKQSIIDDDEVTYRQVLAAAVQYNLTSILAIAPQPEVAP